MKNHKSEEPCYRPMGALTNVESEVCRVMMYASDYMEEGGSRRRQRLGMDANVRSVFFFIIYFYK